MRICFEVDCLNHKLWAMPLNKCAKLSIASRLPIQRQNLMVCLGLLAAIAAVYWPAARFDFTNFDDTLYVTDNGHVKQGLTWDGLRWAFSAFYASNWHPLTWLSHMGDCQFFGLQPGAHHLVSVLFHAANTVLLFVLLCNLTGGRWRSALVAGLFALHPLHVESVAWISERKDVLSTFFGFLSLLFYTRYAQGRSRVGGQGSKTKTDSPTLNYFLALLFFACGLLSKPMLVTWPFVMLLLDWWPLKRLQLSTFSLRALITSRVVVEKIPLFVLSAASSAVTFFAQRHGSSVVALDALSPGARLANAIISPVRYLLKAIWPADLIAFYPYRSWNWMAIAGAAFVLIGISVWAVRRAKSTPHLLMGWLWYLGMLVPVTGLIQVGGQSMADRYTYVPLIGVFIAVVWSVRFAPGKNQTRAVVSAVAVLAICGVLSSAQVRYWQNSETLYGHALKVMPNNLVAHNNLGLALAKQGRAAEAIAEYLAVLKVRPDYTESLFNLAVAQAEQGRTADAIENFHAGLALAPDNAEAHNGLGLAFASQGRTNEAMAEYRTALKLKPDYAEAHNSLANIFISQGQDEQAMVELTAALRLKPDYAEAHSNLAELLAQQGRSDEAQAEREIAARLQPVRAEIRFNLAVTLAVQGRLAESVPEFRAALRIKPNWPEAHYNLGTALAGLGRLAEATVEFREALKLNSAYLDARNNLANVLNQQGRFAEAEAECRAALRINLDFAAGHFNLANALMGQGKLRDAESEQRAALRINPAYADARCNLGAALAAQGRSDEAIVQYRKVLRQNPGWLPAMGRLAWLLATDADAANRKPVEAVSLAERLCSATGFQQPATLDVLAAAYASAGRFPDAIQTAQKAEELALAQSFTDLARQIQGRLSLYRENHPYREMAVQKSAIQ